MDEYVMLLETHRIKVAINHLTLLSTAFLQLIDGELLQLVAKLKAIFDRFDANSLGRLSGAQVEQMLVYMNRPVESVQVRDWLLKLKERDDAIEFPEFVAQYSVSPLYSSDTLRYLDSLTFILIAVSGIGVVCGRGSR